MSRKIAEVQKDVTKITNKVFVKKRIYQIPMKYNSETEEVIIRIRAQRKNLKLEAVGEVIVTILAIRLLLAGANNDLFLPIVPIRK